MFCDLTVLLLAETLEAGHSIEELLSHGIDLMTYVLPSKSSGAELKYISIVLCV